MSDQPIKIQRSRLSRGAMYSINSENISDFRVSIRSKIDEIISQSDLKLETLPKDVQDAFIELVLDTVIDHFEGTQNKIVQPDQPDSADMTKVSTKTHDEREETIWKGSPLLSLTEHYQVTNERVRVITGFWNKNFEEVDLIFIQDIKQSRSFAQRLMNRGDIVIFNSDPNHSKIQLKNVWQSEKVHENLRHAMLQARKRHGLTYFTERKIGAPNNSL